MMLGEGGYDNSTVYRYLEVGQHTQPGSSNPAQQQGQEVQPRRNKLEKWKQWNKTMRKSYYKKYTESCNKSTFDSWEYARKK